MCRAAVCVCVCGVCVGACVCALSAFCIVRSYIYVNNSKKAAYFCVAMATFVTR
jgi:hypothetical protein